MVSAGLKNLWTFHQRETMKGNPMTANAKNVTPEATDNTATETPEPTVESEFMRRMNMTVQELLLPIYDDSWMADNDDARRAISDFRALHQYLGKARQSFDDKLKAEHAKGKLLKVEHIRQPKTVSEKQTTLESFLTGK